MKKIYAYILAAAGLFAAASCQEIVEPAVNAPEVSGETFSLTAVAGMDTKTTLVDGVKTHWTPGDELTVFDANGTNQKFVTAITEPAASAVFTTETFAMPDDMSNAVLLAVYPYVENAVTDFQTHVAGLEIPKTQQAVKDGFDSDASIAYALAMGEDADQRNLSFKNLYGLFKFTVEDEGVTKVTIRTNGAEVLSGTVTLLLNGTITAAGDNTHEVTLEGTFEKGGVYYVAAIPGTYNNGITVLYNDTEIKSTGKVVELKANTVLNLGSIGTPSTGRVLTGSADNLGNWSVDDGFEFVDGGDYYVAKNVSFAQTTEFKVVVDGAWFTTTTLALDEWLILYDHSANMSLGAGEYDFYLTKEDNKLYITAAGSEEPAAPGATPDVWGLIGSMAESGWATDLILEEEGDYYVYKGVTLTTTDEFKFRMNKAWAVQKIAAASPASPDTEYDFVDAGMNNMKVSENGTYDIYLTKDAAKIYIMTAGKTPAEAGQSQYYRFYVQNNLNWTKLNIYAWGGYVTGSWPGVTMTLEDEVEGYGTCKYVEIANGVNIVNFIINNGSSQTYDLTLASENVVALSNGDYLYKLNASDVK